MQQALKREGVELVVSVPLIAKGRLVGAIQLGAREVRSFAPEEYHSWRLSANRWA